jgi:hypothetical protein
MSWQDIPILVCFGIDALGFSLLLVAFVLVARRHWSIARYLLLAGAALCCLGGALMSVPGVVPWWDYSQWYTWLPALGAVLGVAIVGCQFAVRCCRRS